jgi:hypothetical protein
VRQSNALLTFTADAVQVALVVSTADRSVISTLRAGCHFYVALTCRRRDENGRPKAFGLSNPPGNPDGLGRSGALRVTLRWREMDSNLYGASPCQVVFFGLLPVLCSELEGAVLHPVAYDQVPGARGMGSRDRNASKAWRLAA